MAKGKSQFFQMSLKPVDPCALNYLELLIPIGTRAVLTLL